MPKFSFGLVSKIEVVYANKARNIGRMNVIVIYASVRVDLFNI